MEGVCLEVSKYYILRLSPHTLNLICNYKYILETVPTIHIAFYQPALTAITYLPPANIWVCNL